MRLWANSKRLVWQLVSWAAAKATYESRLRAQEAEMAGAQNLDEWLRTRQTPPPGVYKALVVRDLARAYKLEHFIETGTFTGLMVAQVSETFAKIDSIEIDETLYRRARRRFKDCPHIRIHLGNSADVLPRLIADRPGSVLYWLDGHYSGGVTGSGPLHSPIQAELASILSRYQNDVILVDDARLFTGAEGYPTLDELRLFIARAGIDLRLEVADDIIRLLPAAPPGA